MKKFTSLFLGIFILLSPSTTYSEDHIYSVGRNASNMPTIWVNSSNGNTISPSPIMSPPTEGVPLYSLNAIALSSNRIYTVGGSTVFCINNLDGTSIPSSPFRLDPGGAAFASGIAVPLSSSQVYIVGASGANNATLWITNRDGNLIGSPTILDITGSGGSAYGVAISSSRVYSVGNDSSNNATLWINNFDGTSAQSPIKLDPNGGNANGVAILPISSEKLLIEALNKYSPFAPVLR
jgi:hypothetical protein